MKNARGNKIHKGDRVKIRSTSTSHIGEVVVVDKIYNRGIKRMTVITDSGPMTVYPWEVEKEKVDG